jgi:hypothetical protein
MNMRAVGDVGKDSSLFTGQARIPDGVVGWDGLRIRCTGRRSQSVVPRV